MALPAEQARNLPALQEASLLDSIQRAASDPQTDVAKMRELMNMALDLKRMRAEEEYNDALRTVQREYKPVKNNRSNSHTKSKYANLEAINKALVPIYTQHGFSLSFGTTDCPIPDHYRITCRVSHIGGHSEKHQYDVPTDAAGAKGTANKNATQASGSALSYGRRYLTALIFNLTTTDDDDGTSASNADTIGPGQAADIKALLTETASDEAAFLELFGVDSIESLPLTSFTPAIGLLKQRQKRVRA